MRDTHFSKKGSSRFKDVGEKWYRLKSNGHGPVKLPSAMIVRISDRPRVVAQTLSRHERAAVVPPSTAFSVICLAALHICTYIRITRQFPAPTGRATQKLERLPGNLKLQNAFRQVLWQDDG